MKIVIPGGSGQVGTMLARTLHRDGHEVTVLSRRAAANHPWRTEIWDGKSLGPWAGTLEGADAVINLAGLSVNCRYTTRNRRLIKQSRTESAVVIGEAIKRAKLPPKVCLQASTATIYAHRFDQPNDEVTGIMGGNEPNAPDTWRFSIDVATSWEAAFDGLTLTATRKVLLRSAIVMSPSRGGAFDVLLGLARHGLGGTSGNGRQYVSWTHEDDFVGAVYWLIEHDEISGPVNLASPNPIVNADFMRILRQSWGIRIGLPAAIWMMEIGTFFIRTETELVLKSRRVVPGRLLKGGFTFRFPEWPAACRDLCGKWRAANRRTGHLFEAAYLREH